jgi:ribosomal protein L7/L12
MSDFITLRCPNCGGPLKIAPGQESVLCGYCGSENLIRQEGSANKLEAFARCPVCKRNDKVQKISALLRTRPELAAAFPAPAKPTPPAPIAQPQAPELPRLSSLKPRNEGGSGKYWGLTVVLAAIIFISLLIIIFTFNEDRPGAELYLVFAIGSLIAGRIGAAMINGVRMAEKSRKYKAYSQKSYERDKENYQEKLNTYKEQAARIVELNDTRNREYNVSMAAWEKATKRVENMYYCQRDDVVFNPGGKVMPLGNLTSKPEESIGQGSGQFDVVMLDSGPARIEVIKELRQLKNLGLAEAKAMADNNNGIVLRRVDRQEGEQACGMLMAAGAKVEIRKAQ